MLLNRTPRALALTLVLLALLLSACSSTPPSLPPAVVAPPAIPPLPREARQPPVPAWCSPSCYGGLTSIRESWLNTPMRLGSPARPASGPTTR